MNIDLPIKSRPRHLTCIIMMMLGFMIFSTFSKAQVDVLPVTPETELCVDGDFLTLPDIIITETSTGDFTAGAALTLVFQLPVEFEFDILTAPTISNSGANPEIDNFSFNFTDAQNLQITFDVTGIAEIDELNVSGLQVRAISAAATGAMVRQGGTAIINGLPDGTALRNLQSFNEPIITNQPADDTACADGNASFSITATGTSLTYVWQTWNGSDWVPVSGAPYSGENSNELSVSDVSGLNGTQYRCLIGGAGGCSVVSETVTLTVHPLPTGSISGTDAICAGESTDLTFGLTGTGPFNVVYSNGSTSFNLTGISDAHVESVSPSVNTTYSLVSVTDANSCNATSLTGSAVVSVNAPSTASVISGDAAICNGANTGIRVNITGGTGPFTLDIDNHGVINDYVSGTDIMVSPSITTIYTLNAVTDANGCDGTGLSGSATITVNEVPEATVTGDDEVCSGQVLELSLNSSVAGTSFTWSRTTLSGTVTGSSQGPFSGNVISQVLNTDAAGAEVRYTITPTAGACTGLPLEYDVLVKPQPEVVAVPVVDEICSTEATNISLSEFNDLSPVSFNWTATVINGTVSGQANGLGNSIEQTLNTTSSGVVRYRVRATVAGCISAAEDVIITVNPIPEAAVTGDTEICSGESTALLISAVNGIPGTSFTWTSNVISGTVNGHSAGSGNNINQSLTSTTGGVVEYVITPSANDCLGLPVTVQVTVNPTPNVLAQPAAQTICSGLETAINLSNPNAVVGTVFNWTITQSGVTGASAGSGTSIIQALSSTGTIAGTAVYTITPSAGSCSGAPVNVEVTVNPLPDAAAASQEICSGETTNVSITNPNGVGATYTWEVLSNPGGITGAGSGSGNTIAQTLLNPTNAPQVITYRITPRSISGCSGATTDVGITVSPAPVFTLTNDASIICSGEETQVNLNSATNNAVIELISVNAAAGLTGQLTTGATYNTFPTVLSNNITNSTNAPLTLQYEFQIRTGTCLNPVTQTANITVNPPPSFTITNNLPVVCTGENVNIGITSPVAGSIITLVSVNYGSASGSLAAGNTFTSGSTINEVLTNTGNSPVVVEYAFNVSSNGCEGTVQTAQVTVNPRPTLAVVPVQQSICSGSNTTLNLSNPNNVAGTLYTWSVATEGVSGAANQVTPGPGPVSQVLNLDQENVSGTATYSILAVSPQGCSSAAREVIVTVTPVPNALASNATICSGQTTDIPITNPNSVPGTTFNWTVIAATNVSGAMAGSGNRISQVLTTTNANNPGNVVYRITPVSGSCEGSPIEVTVAVNPAPQFTLVNNASAICSGTNLDIDINSNTSGAEVEIINVIAGPDITGQMASGTLFDVFPVKISNAIQNASNVPQQLTYELRVSANDCVNPVTRTATVTINPQPVFSINNLTPEICEGLPVDIQLNSPTSNAIITLLDVDYGTANGTLVAGQVFASGNRITETLDNPGFEAANIQYTFGVTANGCTNPVTQTAEVILFPAPTLNVINQRPVICSGEDNRVLLSTPNVGFDIILQSVDYGLIDGGNLTPGVVFSDGASIEETLSNPTNDPQTVTYTFTIPSPVCPIPVIRTAQVVVNPGGFFTVANLKEEICSDETVQINLSSPVTGAVITLKSVDYGAATGSLSAGVSYSSGASITESIRNLSNNPVTVTYVFSMVSNGCPYDLELSASVLVKPNPTFTVSNFEPDICSESNTNIRLNSPTANARIILNSVNYGAVNGTLTPPIEFLNNQLISENLVNLTNAPINVTYSFTAEAAGCTNNNPATAQVLVRPNPEISLINSTPDICEGTLTNIELVSNTEGAIFTLMNVDYGGGSGTLLPNQAFLPGSVISENIVNGTDNPITVRYTFRVNASSCGPVEAFTEVVVNPTPDFNVINNDPLICSGEAVDIELFSNVFGAEITLSSVNYGLATGNLMPGTSFGGSGVINEVLQNTSNNPVIVTYNFQVSTPGCALPVPKSTQVTVNPQPTFTVSNNRPEICEQTGVDIALNSTVNGTVISLNSVSYGDIAGSLSGGETFISGNRITEVLSNPTLSPQSVTYVFSSSFNGCINTENQVAEVIVNPIPDISISNNLPTLCSNGQTDIDVFSQTDNSVITLTSVVYGGVIGTLSDNATFNPGDKIEDVLINPTNESIEVQYNFQVSALSCINSEIRHVRVRVNPIPEVSASAPNICSGTLTQVQIVNENLVPFTNFSWEVINIDAGITGTSVGASGVGNNISQLLFNNTTGPLGITYRITPTALSCVGQSLDVVQTIDAPNIANAGPDIIVCQGTSPVDITEATLGGGATVANWNLISGSGSITNPNSLTPSYLPGEGEIGIAVLQMIASDNTTCPAVSDEMVIRINRAAFVDAGMDQVICETSPALLSGIIGQAATSATWSSSGDGTFSFAGDLSASYNPGVNDKSGGVVMLTLTSNDPEGPCPAVSDSLNIQINTQAIAIPGTYDPICIDGEVSLSGTIGGSASAGFWQGGAGTFADPNNLNTTYTPSTIEAGTNVTLIFRTDDPAGPCPADVQSTVVRVNSLPAVNFFGLNANYQEDDGAVSLDGVPEGGFFSGPGIIDNTFNPSLAGDGSHVIVYSFTDANGCTNTRGRSTFVFPLPDVEIIVPEDLCTGNSDIILQAIPSGGLFTGTGVYRLGDDYFFSPSTAGANNHEIFYTYTDPNGVVLTVSEIVRVDATPRVHFDVLSNCVSDPVQFRDATKPLQTAFANDEVVSWRWDFGDNSIVNTQQDPMHLYQAASSYNVRLEVTTRFGCTSFRDSIIAVGAVPVTDFTFQSIAFGDDTRFEDRTRFESGPPSTVSSLEWNFGDGTILSGNAAGFSVVNHQYLDSGRFDVRLRVVSNFGCRGEITKPVFIIPSITTYPYVQDFESESGWVVEGTNSSWELGTPAGSVIDRPFDGNNAWVTNLSGEYNPLEQSFINTPSFDLTPLSRPMMSMAIWTHTQVGFDGAVVQYSLDGGLTWRNLGNVDEGIGLNWYTEKGLIGRPGGESNEGSNGWSGVQEGWRMARFPLDEIGDQSAVRFRIAFGSDATNPPESDFNGFAFDAFQVGERERIVLVEHFTNLFSLSSNNANQVVNNVLQARSRDAVSLQYHISSPRPDLIFEKNPNPSNTRGSVYNLTQAPRTVMDGIRNFDFQPVPITQRDVLNRSLVSPLFNIDLSLVEESASNLATVNIELTARDSISDQIVVHVVPVEKNVTEFFLQAGILRNVVKDMLPDPGGTIFSRTWIRGDQASFEETWDLNGRTIYDSTTLAMAVFVQKVTNESTSEIYQAAMIDLPIKYPDRVTSLPDVLLNDAFSDARLYPNPAKDYFKLDLGKTLHKDMDWQIVDMRGVAIAKGKLPRGADSHIFQAGELSEGVHNLILFDADGIVLVKKVVVMKDLY